MTVAGEYLLYLPQNYETSKDKWPLMLFLHGAGERGDDLEKVKVHGPPKLVANGKEFPFVLVSPQCPEGMWWSTDVLDALLNEITENYNIDENRIYVTGLSMGGFGTWALAEKYPHRFAAIAPVCGGGDPAAVPTFSHLPVWVFHGAKDNVVPIDRSEAMVNELKKNGADVQFTVYPEAGHDSWTETYDNPALYEWFLKQRRK
ncbi:MAG: prolyl oligopeptidase family serine peptidase [Calditrichaeota bacterium]|nr:prolyl oligopeptidase family serine peptidase [Calditrichota bacterium]MCB0301015.1 prolyl oligopeptidase family serine peptidase [Calditrichota bacterium]